MQAKAHASAEERVLDALVGSTASPATRENFRKKLRDGELDDKEIDIEVADAGSRMPGFDIPGMPGANIGVLNLSEMFGKAMGGRTKRFGRRFPSPMLILFVMSPTSCWTTK